ncbi:hypothetical protein Pst134EA_019325 [Puccinia striiformis f. sp. tritici]|uniref:hypothetical protein n=1 Tax=Puccinia striiformis f. sp. tritici TaxID=168172 RepID=UPI0020072A28|nr:hypothetical protein Pst134EA_019325 [Puccinia striiformis f. sp. tritici]KAH9459171.1 hypothetical protein Pst134EA_019325 [Puccinia striiformis f. sp. tritici]
MLSNARGGTRKHRGCIHHLPIYNLLKKKSGEKSSNGLPVSVRGDPLSVGLARVERDLCCGSLRRGPNHLSCWSLSQSLIRVSLLPSLLLHQHTHADPLIRLSLCTGIGYQAPFRSTRWGRHRRRKRYVVDSYPGKGPDNSITPTSTVSTNIGNDDRLGGGTNAAQPTHSFDLATVVA